MRVLITGGTGSLGQELINLLLKLPDIKRIRSLSRGEHKIMEAREKYRDKPVDWLVGDVRDFERVNRAMHDCSTVYHLAAFKTIDLAEHDPWDCVLTNIHGTHNVARACIANGVRKCVFVSTDKAVNPYNFYGVTKRAAEALWIQSNVGRHHSKFMVARFGNQFNSNGSVIQKWQQAKAKGDRLYITDPDMTRFFLPINEAAEFVFRAAQWGNRGEIYIPKMKSIRMGDLYDIIVGDYQGGTQTGIRPGEKKHEVLVSADEVWLTTDGGNCYIRYPSHPLFQIKKIGDPLPPDFKEFTSENAERLTDKEIKAWLN